MLLKNRQLYIANSAILIAVYISGMVLTGAVSATPEQTGGAQFPSAKHEPKRGINPETGRLSFIGGEQAIQLPGVSFAKGTLPQVRAMDMANAYGREFGLKDPLQELQLLRSKKDGNGKDVVHFQQEYLGVPILAGELIVNLNEAGDLLSMSGEVSPDLMLDTRPAIKAQAARKMALDEIAKLHKVDEKGLLATQAELWIFDESLLTVSTRPLELVWRLEVTAKDATQPIRELVLVNAQMGNISFHVNQVDVVNQNPNAVSPTHGISSSARSSSTSLALLWAGSRRTYTASGGVTLPGTFLCDENQSICTNSVDADADSAHQFAADTFLFYSVHHNRNSFDNLGSAIISTVHYSLNYRNAFWNGSQMVYGDAMAADDVVGHELTHGVTQYTSGLIYSYQSGAINESFSDVWGEFIDQTNGYGNDSPSVKWLIGEDSALGAIRSMSNPPAYGHPDKMSSPYYYTGSGDNGGVHLNSGVNNKAAYLMVQGGSFNGKTITGIGLNKTAAVYYEVQLHHLTSGANYNDLYYALVQACQNLIGGTDGITQTDCDQVKAAAEAVEMIPASSSTPNNTPTKTPIPTNTFTPTATPVTPPHANNPLYLSLTTNQTIGGVVSSDEDILRFDGINWNLFFDGSDVGVGGSDLFGFSFLDADSILMSFNTALTLNGISVTQRDVLRFDATSLGSNTAGTFSMYLNGIDVGLDVAAENIDSVSLLPDGRVLLSTTGNPVVGGVTGAKDEDVLAFTPTTLGNTTSGTWAMYFDGSDVGLAETSAEDVDALDITSNGKIYLSTSGDFAVTGVSGADEDVFICEPTSVGNVTACNYSAALYFDGSTWGLTANDVDAFNFLSTGPIPTNTPSITPTKTATPTRTQTPIISVTPTRTFTATRTPTSIVGASPTNTPAPTNTPTSTVTSSASDLIFADGFESGNLSAWTSNTNDLGDLSVSAASALIGAQGMQAVLDDNNTIYVTDDSPNVEPRYRARFYFDPNSIPMLSGDAHFILKGFMGTSTEVLRMEFRRSAGLYQLRIALLDDGSTWMNSNWFSISDASHFIELDWSAATGVGANNGSLTFWIDGTQQANLTGVDNDTRRIDRVRLGALTGVDNDTRGTYYFDAFESRRQNYIGPVVSVSTPTATHTPTITPTAGSGLAHVEVYIAGLLQNTYDVSPQSSVRPSYVGLNNGPVKVISTNGMPIAASERFAYNDGSAWTSYSEIMGLPHDEVTTSYSFPWYDNVDFDSQLRFANVGNASSTVTVKVGGVVRGSYVLAPNQSQHVSYPGLDSGPVKVESTNGVLIVASLRVGYFNGSAWTSHSEVMGLPQGQVSTSYIFPWYNNVDINSQLRFGNVGSANTTVTVTVNGIVLGSYSLLPNQSQQISYAGVNSGPVKVESSDGVPIVSSLRFAYFDGSTWTNHSETMGLPAALLSTNYSFPVYDNVNHNSLLSFGNMGTSPTIVSVTINGVLKGSYSLAPNQIVRVSYAGVNNGPVVIQSSGGVPIIASERVAYFNGSAWTSFSELIGLPSSQLSTSYFFPWYDNVNIDTQLRFGVP